MKTTLDIPDDLAREVQRRAQRDGRALAEQFIRLVQIGLCAPDIPAAEAQRQAVAASAPVPESDADSGTSVTLRRDPMTGALVIDSPPDAPIHSIGPDELLRVTQDALAEDDLERAGLFVRH